MMPVQVLCECGQRYRAPEEARGRRLRCKKCGTEIAIPKTAKPKQPKPKPVDEEFDLSGIDPDDAVLDEGPAALPPIRRSTKGKPRREATASSGRFSIGDLVVRGSGLLIFLATVVNCVYQFQSAEPVQAGDLGSDNFLKAILPVLVVGLIALYIAWIGQEPDPFARRANRLRGLGACVLGVVLSIAGVAITYAVNVFLPDFGFWFVFTGLIFGGLITIACGCLSIITGRKFETRRRPNGQLGIRS